MNFKIISIVMSVIYIMPIYSTASDSVGKLGKKMENQNICKVLEGINEISSTNNLNSVKILGPFQRYILKNGEVGNWGMYILPKSILGVPGKLVINFKNNLPAQIILSPSAQHHFKVDLVLSDECIKKQKIFFYQSEKSDNKDYSFVNIFESSKDVSKKLSYRFFSKNIYSSTELNFNRLVINIDQ